MLIEVDEFCRRVERDLGGLVRGLQTPASSDHGAPFEQAAEVLEGPMKITYDAETDTLTIVLRDAPVVESDENKPGVILDYDAAGNVVSMEVLDASVRVEEPRTVTLAIRE